MNDNPETEIIWTGDLNDDCTARWAGLMLRAEWMDGPHWWWAVSDMVTGEEITSSNSDPQECTSGASARERAEKVATSWVSFLRYAKALFIEAVQATAHLPSMLRERAADVTGLEMHSFDASYLEFLDTQILLSPQGPEWTALLRGRRAALQPFCDTSLLRGRVQIGDTYFTVEIHPQTRSVIHWEQHDKAA